MDALWYDYDMSNQKDINKVIKKLEFMSRSSFEYDEWARKCKWKHAIECPICDDNYYDNNSKCETHHHPKTLYTIVENIIDTHLEKNDLDDQTSIAILQEIMDLHLLKKVVYINLCQHCHKKFHAGHPDVLNKVDEVFAGWIAKGKEAYDKLPEEKEEKLIVQVQAPAKIEEIKVDFNLDAPGVRNFKHTATLPEETLKPLLNESPGVDPIYNLPDLPDAPDVKTLNVETVKDFISIDIGDL